MRGIHSRTLAALAALAALTFVATLGAGAAAADDTTPAPDATAAAPAVAPDKPALLTDEKLVELVRKADRVLRGRTSAAVVEMQIKTADYDRTYSMVIWDDARDGEKALVKILGPAMWRGYGTLKVGDRLLSYNPRNDHVTVIGSSMLGDSWMGSHFTNDDLVKDTSLSDDYELHITRTWDEEGVGVAGKAHWYEVELTPKPRAPVVWGRILLTFYTDYPDGELVLPARFVYFRESRPDAEADRTMTFSEVAELGGRLVPKAMKMETADKPGEFTLIRYKKIRFDIDIPGKKFTERALRQ